MFAGSESKPENWLFFRVELRAALSEPFLWDIGDDLGWGLAGSAELFAGLMCVLERLPNGRAPCIWGEKWLTEPFHMGLGRLTWKSMRTLPAVQLGPTGWETHQRRMCSVVRGPKGHKTPTVELDCVEMEVQRGLRPWQGSQMAWGAGPWGS